MKDTIIYRAFKSVGRLDSVNVFLYDKERVLNDFKIDHHICFCQSELRKIIAIGILMRDEQMFSYNVPGDTNG